MTPDNINFANRSCIRRTAAEMAERHKKRMVRLSELQAVGDCEDTGLAQLSTELAHSVASRIGYIEQYMNVPEPLLFAKHGGGVEVMWKLPHGKILVRFNADYPQTRHVDCVAIFDGKTHTVRYSGPVGEYLLTWMDICMSEK